MVLVDAWEFEALLDSLEDTIRTVSADESLTTEQRDVWDIKIKGYQRAVLELYETMKLPHLQRQSVHAKEKAHGFHDDLDAELYRPRVDDLIRLMSQPLSLIAATSAGALPSQQLAAAEVSLLQSKLQEVEVQPISVAVEEKTDDKDVDVGQPSLGHSSTGQSLGTVASRGAHTGPGSGSADKTYMEQRKMLLGADRPSRRPPPTSLLDRGGSTDDIADKLADTAEAMKATAGRYREIVQTDKERLSRTADAQQREIDRASSANRTAKELYKSNTMSFICSMILLVIGVLMFLFMIMFIMVT